jgi:hypothetical protein
MKPMHASRQAILQCLDTHGPQTAKEIADRLQRTASAVHHIIAHIMSSEDATLIELVANAASKSKTYRLVQPQPQPNKPDADTPQARSGPRTYIQPADKEAHDFLVLNVPYLSRKSMARHLGMTPDAVTGLAARYGIDLRHEDKEPRAKAVAAGVGFIPLGSTVEQWLRGTTIHMPCSAPGITRVTRHFTADDGDEDEDVPPTRNEDNTQPAESGFSFFGD